MQMQNSFEMTEELLEDRVDIETFLPKCDLVVDEYDRKVYRFIFILKELSDDRHYQIHVEEFNKCKKFYSAEIFDYDESGRPTRFQRICEEDYQPYIQFYWWFDNDKVKAYKEKNLKTNFETFYEYNKQGDCIHFKGKDWTKAMTEEQVQEVDYFKEFTYYPSGRKKSVKIWNAGEKDYVYLEYKDSEWGYGPAVDWSLFHVYNSKTGEEEWYKEEKNKINVQLDLFGYPINWD